MGFGDWIGIISLGLAVPLGIATNLLTPHLVSYLDRRRLIKWTRSKGQELRVYRQVKAFRDGTRDKYPFYIMMGALCVCFELAASTLALTAFITFPHPHFDITALEPARFVIGLLSGAFFALGAVFLVTISATERRIDNFDEYTAEVREKWGDDAV
ncbi:MFS family permease [Bradyrhizobium sp. LB1.3]